MHITKLLIIFLNLVLPYPNLLFDSIFCKIPKLLAHSKPYNGASNARELISMHVMKLDPYISKIKHYFEAFLPMKRMVMNGMKLEFSKLTCKAHGTSYNGEGLKCISETKHATDLGYSS